MKATERTLFGFIGSMESPQEIQMEKASKQTTYKAAINRPCLRPRKAFIVIFQGQ